MFEKHVEDKAGIEIGPERMTEELDEIRAVEIKTDKRVYFVQTEIKGKRYKILRASGVKIPPLSCQSLL